MREQEEQEAKEEEYGDEGGEGGESYEEENPSDVEQPFIDPTKPLTGLPIVSKKAIDATGQEW